MGIGVGVRGVGVEVGVRLGVVVKVRVGARSGILF